MSYLKYFLLTLFILLLGPLYLYFTQPVDLNLSYQKAFRGSAHLAFDPQTHKEALVEVYAARAFNWRGFFADHTWIAVKPQDAKQYTIYQVIGWRLFRGLPAVAINEDLPDRYWYGAKPQLILSVSGAKAAELIPQIEKAAQQYPYKNRYTAWPGPNSNTFIAYIARSVPDLGLALPPTALGQDYLGPRFFAKTPSGTGYQVSLFGLVGLSVAEDEGIRFNMLGLLVGVNFKPLGVIYPGVGVVR